MNKKVCQQNKAVDYVCREQQILMALSHSFIVNLWYAFQDQEDMFMVVELFRGGDLRLHELLFDLILKFDQFAQILVLEKNRSFNIKLQNLA